MSKKLGLSTLALLACVVMTSTANAKKGKGLIGEYTGQGYGLAGCGLGSMLFGPEEGAVQIFAGTTNGLAGNQTFGITVGTSNCDIPRMGQQAAAFIENNKEVVRKEAARGEGETVTAISVLLNCKEPALANDLRSQFDYYFGQNVGSYESVRRIMKSGNCSVEG